MIIKKEKKCLIESKISLTEFQNMQCDNATFTKGCKTSDIISIAGTLLLHTFLYWVSFLFVVVDVSHVVNSTKRSTKYFQVPRVMLTLQWFI